jgi:hypothetical protein
MLELRKYVDSDRNRIQASDLNQNGNETVKTRKITVLFLEIQLEFK